MYQNLVISWAGQAQRWASQCPEGTLLLLSVNTGPKARFGWLGSRGASDRPSKPRKTHGTMSVVGNKW